MGQLADGPSTCSCAPIPLTPCVAFLTAPSAHIAPHGGRTDWRLPCALQVGRDGALPVSWIAPPHIVSLVARMVQREPSSRPTAAECADQLLKGKALAVVPPPRAVTTLPAAVRIAAPIDESAAVPAAAPAAALATAHIAAARPVTPVVLKPALTLDLKRVLADQDAGSGAGVEAPARAPPPVAHFGAKSLHEIRDTGVGASVRPSRAHHIIMRLASFDFFRRSAPIRPEEASVTL